MKKPFDMDPREFSRHERAEESRLIMEELRKNNGLESDELGRLTIDFAHTTDATSFLLASWECPPEFRGFIDVIVGLAGYRAQGGDWFPGSDQEISRRANRCTKWVQNQRREFLKWQDQYNVAMIDIEDNDYNDGHPIPHKYRVNLPRIAAEVTLNARQSKTWGANPGIALEESARILRDSLPEVPVHKKHRKSSRYDDPENRMERDLGCALTKVKAAVQTNELTGNKIQLSLKMMETIADIKSYLAMLIENVRPDS